MGERLILVTVTGRPEPAWPAAAFPGDLYPWQDHHIAVRGKADCSWHLILYRVRCVAYSYPPINLQVRISVVLHKTELVALGIGHDDDYALVVVVSFAGGPSSQADNKLGSLVDVVDGHVKMDADLPCLRLGNRLEDQPRLGIAAMAQVNPAGLRRPRLATEQGAPEARDPLRVHAVDGHSRHEVRHVRHLTVATRCRGGAQDQQNAEPIAA
jgi:hypothetical protein